MPRAKEFDEAEVLDKALSLFRARGFSQTSFSDLTVGLGVNRQSLYDTYGDKQTLYLTALKRYSERGLEMMERKLDESRPVRTVLSELFQGIISSNCDCGSPGCLMVNSMVEMAPHDEEVRQLARDHFDAVEALLAKRLALAQETGELSRFDYVRFAMFVTWVACLCGCRQQMAGQPAFRPLRPRRLLRRWTLLPTASSGDRGTRCSTRQTRKVRDCQGLDVSPA